MDGEIVFEGSIKHTVKKKTQRAKLKLIIKKINETDASMDIDMVLVGTPIKSKVVVHNNPNKTVNVDGYYILDKKRRPMSMKNVKLDETQKQEMSLFTNFTSLM